MATTPKFIVSYQGESDYMIDGRRYSVRTHSLDNSSSVRPERQRERQFIGTIKVFLGCDYPAPWITALFPGYIAARYNPATMGIEYWDDEKPVVLRVPSGYVAAVHRKEEEAAGLWNDEAKWAAWPVSII